MIFYKQYPYAPRATFVSVLCSLVALMFVLTGVALFTEAIGEKEYGGCVLAVLIAAVAIPIYIFGSNKWSAKIAKKDGLKNIYTKAKYGLRYVNAHPEAYETILQANPAFAAKYVRNEQGKIVKR